jgi:hypothetical protein
MRGKVVDLVSSRAVCLHDWTVYVVAASVVSPACIALCNRETRAHCELVARRNPAGGPRHGDGWQRAFDSACVQPMERCKTRCALAESR